MDVIFRSAEVSDILNIIPLWKELFLFHETMDKSFETSSDAETHYTSFLNVIIESQKKKEAFLFVAETQPENKLVGYIMGMRHKNPPVLKTREFGSIYDICVTEQFRRQDIGENLVKEVKKWCEAQGLNRIEMHAATANPVALAFWKKMEFTPFMEKMYFNN